MLQLKIDVVGNDFLTKTFYSTEKYNNIGDARKSAENCKNKLFQKYITGEIKDYTVDITPLNI